MEVKKNSPQLRFSGFDEAWNEERLELLAEFTKGKGYSKNDLKTEGTPIILYGRLYTNYQSVITDVDTYTNPKEKSYYSKGGEVIVPASGETQEDIVRASVVSKPDTILGGDLNIINSFESIDPHFLALSISNGKVHHDLVKKAQGKSVVHIRNNDLKETSIPFPMIEEQQLIGSFFKTIDNLITKHQKKHERLINLKKAMLEKMFPKEGETVPEIRFQGFEEDWKETTLGKVSDVRDGTHESPRFQKTGYPLVTSKNLTTKGLDLKNCQFISNNDFEEINKRSKVDIGDIIFGMIGTIGNPVLLKRDDFAIKNVALVKSNNNISNYFLLQLFKSGVFKFYIRTQYSGSTQKFLGLDKIREFRFRLPRLDEQIKIGEYFERIDGLISNHQKQLDKLLKLKKSLSERMFL